MRLGKRQAAVLKALSRARGYNAIARRAGTITHNGHPTAEFRRVFASCLRNSWVHVAQWGDGGKTPMVYELSATGRAALAEWEALHAHPRD